MVEAEKKSSVILPDFLEVTFTLKECFVLNTTELNEREGKNGVAEPGEEAALCSQWTVLPRCSAGS